MFHDLWQLAQTPLDPIEAGKQLGGLTVAQLFGVGIVVSALVNGLLFRLFVGHHDKSMASWKTEREAVGVERATNQNLLITTITENTKVLAGLKTLLEQDINRKKIP